MDDELEKEEIRPGDESGKVTEEEAEKEQEEEYEPAEEEDNGDNDEDDDEDEGVPEESDEDGVDNKRGKRPTAANSKRKVTVKGSTKVTTAASRTQPVNSRKGPATLSTTNGKGKQVAGMTSAASVSKTSVGGIARRAPLRSPSPVKLGSAVSPGGPIRRVGLSKRARLKPISPVKLPPPS